VKEAEALLEILWMVTEKEIVIISSVVLREMKRESQLVN